MLPRPGVKDSAAAAADNVNAGVTLPYISIAPQYTRHSVGDGPPSTRLCTLLYGEEGY